MHKGPQGTKKPRVNVKSKVKVDPAAGLVWVMASVWQAFYIAVIGFALYGAFSAHRNYGFIFKLSAKSMVLMRNVSDLDAHINQVEGDLVILDSVVTNLSTTVDILDMRVDTLNITLNTRIDNEISSVITIIGDLNTTLCTKIMDLEASLQMELAMITGISGDVLNLTTKVTTNMQNIMLLQNWDLLVQQQIMAIQHVGAMLANTTMDLNVTIIEALIDVMAFDGRIAIVEGKSMQNMMDLMGVGQNIQGGSGALHPAASGTFTIVGGDGIITTSSASDLSIAADIDVTYPLTKAVNLAGKITIDTDAVHTITINGGGPFGFAFPSNNVINLVSGAGINIAHPMAGNAITISSSGVTSVNPASVNLAGIKVSPTTGAVQLEVEPYLNIYSMQPFFTAHWCMAGKSRTQWASDVNIIHYSLGAHLSFVQVGASTPASYANDGQIVAYLLCDGYSATYGGAVLCIHGATGCRPITSLNIPQHTVFATAIMGSSVGTAIAQDYPAQFVYWDNTAAIDYPRTGMLLPASQTPTGLFPDGPGTFGVSGFQFFMVDNNL